LDATAEDIDLEGRSANGGINPGGLGYPKLPVPRPRDGLSFQIDFFSHAALQLSPLTAADFLTKSSYAGMDGSGRP